MNTAARTAVPAPRTAPDSLTQQRPDQQCPQCRSGYLTHLSMTLTDGSLVQFTSCHRCEHRFWSQDGQPLALPSVLAKARKPR